MRKALAAAGPAAAPTSISLGSGFPGLSEAAWLFTCGRFV